jgi:hypothetical protein
MNKEAYCTCLSIYIKNNRYVLLVPCEGEGIRRLQTLKMKLHFFKKKLIFGVFPFQ